MKICNRHGEELERKRNASVTTHMREHGSNLGSCRTTSDGEPGDVEVEI
jgi:hypothetical protein